MLEKDTFAELRHSQEEKYFIQKEQELIKQLRRRIGLENELENISHTKEVVTEELLRDLQELGYTRKTLSLLHIVPLVYVAWSEGFVTDRERQLIFSISRARGIEENSAAESKLKAWLEESPTEEFFQKSLGIIQTVLHALPPEEEAVEKLELVKECRQVAEVSRNLLEYWGAITPSEQEAINHVAEELEREHYTIAKQATVAKE
jgi:site-specific DNA-cytosine methylase